MPLPEAQRQEMILATKNAAMAFLEDMDHLREIAKGENASRRELRLLSVTLRRLLVYGELKAIADPRLGRIQIESWDNQGFFRIERKMPFEAFISGGFTAFGLQYRGLIITKSSHPPMLSGFHPEATVPLKIGNFIAQRVLCLSGNWATRKDVIMYVANILGAAHSGTARDETETLLLKISMSCKVWKNGIQVSVPVNNPNPNASTPAFSYSPDIIDPLLLELLAIAKLLTLSPDIGRLEEHIKNEFAQAP